MNILDYARGLKKLENGDYLELAYPDDIKRMIKICKDRSIDITPELAQELWINYSDDMCASWLILPQYDDDVFKILIEYAKKYSVGDKE